MSSSGSNPFPKSWGKVCSRCGVHKSWARFRRQGESVAITSWCSACRHKGRLAQAEREASATANGYVRRANGTDDKLVVTKIGKAAAQVAIATSKVGPKGRGSGAPEYVERHWTSHEERAAQRKRRDRAM